MDRQINIPSVLTMDRGTRGTREKNKPRTQRSGRDTVRVEAKLGITALAAEIYFATWPARA
jgi:hypothetical protein